jgi:hypothetical protein
MSPFKLALWITKFVGALVLLLVVIPYGLFLGGAYVTVKIADAYRAQQLATHLRDVDTCVKANGGEPAREACSANPKHPVITEVTTCVGKSTHVTDPETAKAIERWCTQNPQRPLILHSTREDERVDPFEFLDAENIACGGTPYPNYTDKLAKGAETCESGQ